MSLSFGLEIVPRLTIEPLCDQGFVGQVKWQPLRPNLQQPKPIPDDKRPGMTQTRVERQIMCDLGNKSPRKSGQDIPKTVVTWSAWQWNYVKLIGFEQFRSINCDCTCLLQAWD